MNRFRFVTFLFAVAAACLALSGCPNGGVPGTFALYIVNASSETVGLVGLDNHQDPAKALVDVLDENVPAGSMKVLLLSQATYGDDNASVQIGIVNIGFVDINGVQLGQGPTVLLVEDDGQSAAVREIEYQE
ncbi:MAG: hypothetical protein FJY92_03850 [Candidatus Hydrogenedentes bacterium]|nr:hypothetical protein [Candidatus Hydrogenedentota bacterium]